MNRARSAEVLELRVMADFGAHPLWLVAVDGAVRNPAPGEIVAPELARRLDAWAQRYDASYDAERPPDSRFASADEERAFVADGRALASEVAAAVAVRGWRVRYATTTGYEDIPGDRRLPGSSVERVRTSLLAGSQDFSRTWLADGRVAVPIPEAVAFPAPFAVRIADALSADGGPGWGVLAASWPGYREPDGRLIGPDAAGVTAFFDDMAPVDRVITTPGLAFAVLLTQDEYGLVGGPRATVEALLAMTVTAAAAAFDEYAAEMTDAARHLPDVAARYRRYR